MAKQKMAVYFQPETIKKIEQEYHEDNCSSKTEFIEKAVKFYIGYIYVIEGIDSANENDDLKIEFKQIFND